MKGVKTLCNSQIMLSLTNDVSVSRQLESGRVIQVSVQGHNSMLLAFPIICFTLFNVSAHTHTHRVNAVAIAPSYSVFLNWCSQNIPLSLHSIFHGSVSLEIMSFVPPVQGCSL